MAEDDDAPQIIETTPTRFPKWEKLPDEVQEYAMQFCTKRSRINLALCSRETNKLIRSYNRIRPISLELKEFDKYVLVEYKYNDKRQVPKTINAMFRNEGFKKHACKTKTPLYSMKVTCVGSKKWAHEDENKLKQYDGTFMGALAKYLDRQFGHVEPNRFTFKLNVLMAKWHPELASFLGRCKDCKWTIQMNNSVYWPFKRLMENHSLGKPLHFLKAQERFANDPKNAKTTWSNPPQLQLPKEFFESELFKNTKKFHCHLPSLLTDSHFLETNFDSLIVHSASVSLVAILSKIRSLIAENSKTFEKFVIRRFEDSSQRDLIKYYSDNSDYLIKDLLFKKSVNNTYHRDMGDGTFARLDFLLVTRGISFEMNVTNVDVIVKKE